MAIDLFGTCQAPSLGGIKRLKIATRGTDELPLVFPLDIELKTNDESIIMLSDDEDNRTITLGSQQIQYRLVMPFHATLEEEETTTRQGRYYTQKLDFEISKLNLTTINQLKAFLFTDGGEFSISNAMCLIEDMNGVLWICGYMQPLVLEEFEMDTGTTEGDNKYTLSYTCKTYARIRQVELK